MKLRGFSVRFGCDLVICHDRNQQTRFIEPRGSGGTDRFRSYRQNPKRTDSVRLSCITIAGCWVKVHCISSMGPYNDKLLLVYLGAWRRIPNHNFSQYWPSWLMYTYIILFRIVIWLFDADCSILQALNPIVVLFTTRYRIIVDNMLNIYLIFIYHITYEAKCRYRRILSMVMCL